MEELYTRSMAFDSLSPWNSSIRRNSQLGRSRISFSSVGPLKGMTMHNERKTKNFRDKVELCNERAKTRT